MYRGKDKLMARARGGRGKNKIAKIEKRNVRVIRTVFFIDSTLIHISFEFLSYKIGCITIIRYNMKKIKSL